MSFFVRPEDRKINHAGFSVRPKRIVKKPHKPLTMGSRMTHICWRLSNPTEEDKTRFLRMLDKPEGEFQESQWNNIRYIIGQLESTTGDLMEDEDEDEENIHLQGYLELKYQRKFNIVKQIIGGKDDVRAHLERRLGTAVQASDYCKKEESRVSKEDGGYSFEKGLLSNQGRRNIKRKPSQLDNIALDINDGRSITEIEEDYPGTFMEKKDKIVSHWINKQGPRRLIPNNNIISIFIGDSGFGKSTTAERLYPNAYHGEWPTGGRWWWPDYRGQETIIFDEFRHQIKYDQMLKLFDIHPMGVEYKGGNTQNISKKIIVTTIHDPVEWYKGVQDKQELQRRIREYATIYDFNGEGEYPNFEYEEREEEFTFDAYVHNYL